MESYAGSHFPPKGEEIASVCFWSGVVIQKSNRILAVSSLNDIVLLSPLTEYFVELHNEFVDVGIPFLCNLYWFMNKETALAW